MGTVYTNSLLATLCSGANGLAHCCYDPSGNLKIGPPSGGHLHIEQEREFDRLRRDVIPYIYCCKDRQFDNCEKYYERRPSDDGSDFDPPPPGIYPYMITYYSTGKYRPLVHFLF